MKRIIHGFVGIVGGISRCLVKIGGLYRNGAIPARRHFHVSVSNPALLLLLLIHKELFCFIILTWLPIT
jgi:hypothetical protein